MATLQSILAQKIPVWRDDVRRLVAEHGDKVVSQVTVGQLYGGMRELRCMVCDTSDVDPDKGLRIRGRPISELTDRLPEEMFFLLCTGELPDEASLKALQNDLRERAAVPKYVWNVLRDLPDDAHPMEMLDAAIVALERDSQFRQRYTAGIRKEDYWAPVLEDAINLLAKLPAVAAAVYRIHFGKGKPLNPDPALDWAGNYAHLLGIPDPLGEFANLLRLYLTLHCDHEGGNVSAFTSHVVGSSLADPFYAVSAGIDGLAGPLHGLANQECVGFILDVQREFDGVPTDEELRRYCWKLLESGRVIPGYGHAVLRCTDPRFVALHAFAQRVGRDDPVLQIMDQTFRIAPEVLREQGKAKNTLPNVDAASGALLYHFGLTELSYYTVVFAVSRAMGMLAQLVLNRGIGSPITRPKSVTTDWVKAQVRK